MNCEVQGLRRLARTGEGSPGRAGEAIADLTALDLHRHPHLDLLERAWRLRDNVPAYDAMYVALAEALDAAIVTCDGATRRGAPTPRPDRSRRLGHWVTERDSRYRGGVVPLVIQSIR